MTRARSEVKDHLADQGQVEARESSIRQLRIELVRIELLGEEQPEELRLGGDSFAPMTGHRRRIFYETVLTTFRLRTSPVRRLGDIALQWVVPLAIACLMLGPALGPGALFNLDLVVVPRLELPAGFWGLGPELPRRLPLWVPIAALSPVVPATISAKILMVALFMLAWSGMMRLARTLGVVYPAAAAAIFAFSPFMLTRTAVGHFPITITLAVLPWVIRHLLQPGRDLGATFLAAAALSVGGHFGGSVALLTVVTGIITGPRERAARGFLVTAAAQAVWLVPAVVVAATVDTAPATGAVFRSDLRGVVGALSLSAGGGFWNTYFQVGNRAVMAVAGSMLLALAIVGTRSLPAAIRTPLTALGTFGWAIPVLATLGFSRSIVDIATSNIVGAVWRDSQRLIVVHLLWLAPASCLGAQRAATWAGHRIVRAGAAAMFVPLGIAVALSTPGLWGIGGQIDAERLPGSWTTARDIVRADTSTVLALPWAQYYNQSIGNGRIRRVLNPMPLFLGGDVIASSDSGLSADVRERGDQREESVDRAVDALVDDGSELGPATAELGIDWIVVHHSALDDRYRGLSTDESVELVFDSDEISVFRVSAPTASDYQPRQRGPLTAVALAGQIGWLVAVAVIGAGTGRRVRQGRSALAIAGQRCSA